MINRYYIIDDFYEDPDKIVQTVETLAIEENSRGNYAGSMTYDGAFTQFHLDFFGKLVNHPVQEATSLNGKFRYTLPSDTCRQYIHFDFGFDMAWAGVVYLSKQHPTVSGTEFWKHKRTGLEEIPRTLDGLHKYQWEPNNLQRFLETEGMDTSLWERTLVIPYKYNRLVLFRPWLFHSPGPAFGTERMKSRLIQTFFLKNG